MLTTEAKNRKVWERHHRRTASNAELCKFVNVACILMSSPSLLMRRSLQVDRLFLFLYLCICWRYSTVRISTVQQRHDGRGARVLEHRIAAENYSSRKKNLHRHIDSQLQTLHKMETRYSWTETEMPPQSIVNKQMRDDRFSSFSALCDIRRSHEIERRFRNTLSRHMNLGFF